MAAGTALSTLARVGFAARGILYIVIALLVITTGRAEDQSGAMDYLGHGLGKALLIAMTAGFIAYGIWRLSDAALNIEAHEDGVKGYGGRAAAAGSGIVYLFFAWRAVHLIEGVSSGGGGTQEAVQRMHGDHTMFTIAGLILLAVGGYQLFKAAKAGFCKNLDAGVANAGWVKITGRIGYGARAIVFLISSYFLLHAGLSDGGGTPKPGMDRVLAWLSSPWDVLVALGLLMFGLFSFIEARFRRIHEVPVSSMARQLRSKVGA
jgi:Domain of Unknown Function (DUF1206)